MKSMADFRINHPERLLREYLYRNPKSVLELRERKTLPCDLDCTPPFKPPSKKISEQCVMRYEFMSNNYRKLDDGYAVDFDH